MRAKEFILNENRIFISEEYQRTAVLLEQFCKQAVDNKFTARQILKMFEATAAGTVPATGPASPQDVSLVQQGKQTLSALKGSLQQGIQRAGEQVQNFDQQFDSYATRLAQKYPGTNNVIQAFRKFAEEHPVAEHAILIVLSIVLACKIPGIIGAAIAIGLLTFAYKLILGKKFSQSLEAGVGSGALAGALGSAVNGIETLAAAHHASPILTTGAEQIAHGALETELGHLAAAAPTVAKSVGTVANAVGRGAALARSAGGAMVESSKINSRRKIRL